MSLSKQSRRFKEIAATKAYYEKHAAIWTSTKVNSFHHEAEFTQFTKLLKPKASIIDIGCAWGIHVPLFMGIGRHLRYQGIDIARSFLKIARRRYPQLNFGEGNIADASTLPKKRFDGFLAVAVLMHIPKESWDRAFMNIEGLVKSGGYGYLSFPTEHPSGDSKSLDSRHFTLMSESEHVSYLKKRGWKILKKTHKKGSGGKDIWRGYIVRLP
jgi:2-polyprenyl-3-methyl-5-hydroxy-6-metoxy-1,4-benzoquinol methylase